MPVVKGKKYPYTPKGKAAAKSAASRSKGKKAGPSKKRGY